MDGKRKKRYYGSYDRSGREAWWCYCHHMYDSYIDECPKCHWLSPWVREQDERERLEEEENRKKEKAEAEKRNKEMTQKKTIEKNLDLLETSLELINKLKPGKRKNKLMDKAKKMTKKLHDELRENMSEIAELGSYVDATQAGNWNEDDPSEIKTMISMIDDKSKYAEHAKRFLSIITGDSFLSAMKKEDKNNDLTKKKSNTETDKKEAEATKKIGDPEKQADEKKTDVGEILDDPIEVFLRINAMWRQGDLSGLIEFLERLSKNQKGDAPMQKIVDTINGSKLIKEIQKLERYRDLALKALDTLSTSDKKTPNTQTPRTQEDELAEIVRDLGEDVDDASEDAKREDDNGNDYD